jgi:hypothetical protein
MSDETRGDIFRKKIKDKRIKDEKIGDKRRSKSDKKIKFIPLPEFNKSLENLQKDFRFPKKTKRMPEDRGPRPAPSSTDIPAPKEPRKPGEEKIMKPLAKGGRAMYKSGGRGCKLAMKGKGRAYGKNS